MRWSNKAVRAFVAFAIALTPLVVAPDRALAVTGVPSAPISVTAVPAAAGITMTWSAPLDMASQTRTAYQVEYATTASPNSWTVSSSVISSTATSYTIPGLNKSTSYYVRIAAKYSAGLGSYGYPWTKVYRTSTPTRSGATTSGQIVYDSGFGLPSTAGSVAAGLTASYSDFTRVRYLMKTTDNSTERYVDADFLKSTLSTAPSYLGGYAKDLSTVGNLMVPDYSTNGQFAVQGDISDLTIYSSNTAGTPGTAGAVVSGNGFTGALELWPFNYDKVVPAGISGRGDGSVYDSADTAALSAYYGSFQLFNTTAGSVQTAFAWNNHASGANPEIGFGNYNISNAGVVHTDWTFCAGNATYCPTFGSASANVRSNFSLEIGINKPVTPLTGSALTPTYGAVAATDTGFTTQISNYDSNYTWTASSSAGGTATINSSGLLTVSGLSAATSTTVTVNTSRTDYANGSSTVSGTSRTYVTNGTCQAYVNTLSGVSVYQSGTTCYIAFKNTGTSYTWNAPTGISIFNATIVGGGGGGASRAGGGGGGGEFIEVSNATTTGSASIAVTVGAGGTGGPSTGSGGTAGTNGSASSISGTTGTTSYSARGGLTGYYAGGAYVGAPSTYVGGTGGQANNSCTGYSGTTYWCTGGGAGASASGENADNGNNNRAGNGGAGKTAAQFSSAVAAGLGGIPTQYSGGGGGGIDLNGTPGLGAYGGGNGSAGKTPAGLATANSGGGGGGSGYDNGGEYVGGAGGSGIVVISYSNTMNVTYNVDGGSAVAATTFTLGGSIADPGSPTKAGYNFSGWAATAGGTALTFPYTPNSSADIVLYAKWTSFPYVAMPSGTVGGFNTSTFVDVSTSGTTPALSGFTTGTYKVVITAGSGYIKLPTWPGTLTKTSGAYDGTGSSVVFTTTSLTDLNSALGALQYKGATGGSANLKIEVTDSTGNVWSSGTGFNSHYYEVVSAPSGINWTNAKSAAAAKTVTSTTGATCSGYLVTITSAEELAFVQSRITQNTWIGASDDYLQINSAAGYAKYASQTASEGKWHWVTGPEAGIQFLTSNSYTAKVSGQYSNFASGEPNNSSSSEHAGQMYTSGGTWNDLPATSTQTNYVVEYGDGSCTPAAGAANSMTASSIGVSTAPTIGTITAGNAQLSVPFTAPASDGGATITDYKYSTNNGSTWTSAGTTTSPIVITGLTNGTTYNIKLLAVNSMGDGPASTAVAATPITTAGAPTLGAITPGNSQLSVAFTAPAVTGGTAITNYKYSTDGGSSWTSAGSTTSPIVITGLTNGTTYSVKLLAVNGAGDGTASGAVSGSPGTAPSAPTITSVTVASSSSLTVSFTHGAENGRTISSIKYALSADGGSTFPTVVPLASTATSFTIAGLSTQTNYVVKVLDVNALGDGAWSANSSTSRIVTITYDGNKDQHQLGVVTGTVATTTYSLSTSTNTAAIQGTLARAGFTFNGWNTNSTGTGTAYAVGATIPTSSSNITLYAQWVIPTAAKLITGTETWSNFSGLAAGKPAGNIRGITTDGTYVYYRLSSNLNIIRQVTLDNVWVSDHTVSGLNGNENVALSYSNGCIFLKQTLAADTAIQCVDTSDWSVTNKATPAGNGLFTGNTWLEGNIIDFPDGRIGAVSAAGKYTSSANSALCPSVTSTNMQCKVLRLYTVNGTGKNSSLAFSEDIFLADRYITGTDSLWPTDDHGIATDGTYLYQINHASGYKTWGMRSGANSQVVFNGAGTGACGASGTLCPINTVNNAGITSNATYISHSHVGNFYIVGDYAGTRFYKTAAAAPPAGGIGAATSYTATFDSKGGSAVAAQTYFTTINEPIAPTKSGSDFAGWSLTDGGEKLSLAYKPNVPSNLTLYALWVDSISAATAPTDLTLTPGNARIDVSFTDIPTANLGGGTLVRYEYSTDGTNWTSNNTSTSFSLTGLTNNTTYTVRVRAVTTNSITTLNGNIASASATPNIPPSNTGVPAISVNGATSATYYGKTFTATTGTWTGSSLTYTYQWQRSDASSAGGTWTDIASATSSTYTAVTADLDKYLRVKVTATNSVAASAYSLSSTQILDQPATNSVAPAITGTTTVDSQITVGNGTWAGTRNTFTYQWYRSDTSGGIYSAVSGATLDSYTLLPADGGKYFKSVVTATNSYGSATAESVATVAIAKNTQTISNFVNPGTKLFSAGSATISAESNRGLILTFASTDSSICAAGAGSLSDNTTSATVTFYKAGTCTIATSQSGTTAYQSATLANQSFVISPVTPNAPTGISAVVHGKTVTISWSSPSISESGGAPATSFRVENTAFGGNSCTTNGALSCNISFTPAATSYSFKVNVTTAGGTSGWSTSSNSVTTFAPAEAISDLTLTHTSETISGTFTGLTTVQLNGATLDHYEYQIDSGSWISIGTETTFTSTGLTNGRTYGIKVRAISSGAVGDGSFDSVTGASSSTVSRTPNVIPVNSSAPLFTGHIWYGQTINWTSDGAWTGTGNAYAYQWQISTTGTNGSWADISGQTSKPYTFALADIGKFVRLKVTATNASGDSGVGYSLASTQILDQPAANSTLPTISGSVIVDSTLTVTPGTWTGTNLQALTYEWFTSSDNNLSNAISLGAATTSLTRTLTGAESGKYLWVKETATNTYGSTSVTVQVVGAVAKASQTIIGFTLTEAKPFANGTLDISSQNSKNLLNTYVSNTPTICSVGLATLNSNSSEATLTYLTAGTCSITAKQAGTNAYLPAADVTQSFEIQPSAPTQVRGVASSVDGNTISTSWFAPLANGGSPIARYIVSATSSGTTRTCTSVNSSCEITGLTPGTAYDVTVVAENTATSVSPAMQSAPTAALKTLVPAGQSSTTSGTIPPTVVAKPLTGILGTVTETTQTALINSGVIAPPPAVPVINLAADLSTGSISTPTNVVVSQTVQSGSQIDLAVRPPSDTPVGTAVYGTLILADGETFDLGRIGITTSNLQSGFSLNPFSILQVGRHIVELRFGTPITNQAIQTQSFTAQAFVNQGFTFGNISTATPIFKAAAVDSQINIRFEINIVAGPNGVPRVVPEPTPTPTETPTPEPATQAAVEPQEVVDPRGLVVTNPLTDAPLAVAQTTLTAVALVAAASAAAAAAGAVSAAAGAGASAAGASSGGGGAARTSGGGSSGGSSSGGGSSSSSSSSSSSGGGSTDGGGEGGDDEASMEGVEFEHEGFEAENIAWGDELKIWSIPALKALDEPSHRATEKLAPLTPLTSKLISDGAYLKAIMGALALIFPALAVALGLHGVSESAGQLLPPSAPIVTAIAVLGVFDAFAGFIAMAIYIIGMVLTAGVHNAADLRMLMGLVIIGIGPSLLAGAFRSIRKPAEVGHHYWWERLTDLAVGPFLGGWATKGMVEALTPLAGVELPIHDHANAIAISVALALMGRILLEEVAARFYPSRLNFIHPTDVLSPSNVQQIIALSLRAGIFFFVAGAFIGNSWHLYAGTFLFIAPSYLSLLQDRFPNYPKLYQILPAGLPGLAFTLLVASGSLTALTAVLGETPSLAQIAFVVLPIPSVILSILGMLGREPAEGDVRWYQREHLTWLYRIGGIFMLIYTMHLTGIL